MSICWSFWFWFFCYRVFIRYCVFFSRILESLPPHLRQHSAAIGWKSLIVMQAREGLQWIVKQTQFFPEHPVCAVEIKALFYCCWGCRNNFGDNITHSLQLCTQIRRRGIMRVTDDTFNCHFLMRQHIYDWSLASLANMEYGHQQFSTLWKKWLNFAV